MGIKKKHKKGELIILPQRDARGELYYECCLSGLDVICGSIPKNFGNGMRLRNIIGKENLNILAECLKELAVDYDNGKHDNILEF